MLSDDDRELLELAAKAAGMTLGPWREDFGAFMYGGDARPGSIGYWNALDIDGDALRLAVELRLAIDIGVVSTSISGPQEWQQDFVVESHNDAPYAATRRAIVRAAAEIGRQHD